MLSKISNKTSLRLAEPAVQLPFLLDNRISKPATTPHLRASDRRRRSRRRNLLLHLLDITVAATAETIITTIIVTATTITTLEVFFLLRHHLSNSNKLIRTLSNSYSIFNSKILSSNFNFNNNNNNHSRKNSNRNLFAPKQLFHKLSNNKL